MCDLLVEAFGFVSIVSLQNVFAEAVILFKTAKKCLCNGNIHLWFFKKSPVFPIPQLKKRDREGKKGREEGGKEARSDRQEVPT